MQQFGCMAALGTGPGGGGVCPLGSHLLCPPSLALPPVLQLVRGKYDLVCGMSVFHVINQVNPAIFAL